MILIDHLHNLGNFGQHMNAIPPEQELVAAHRRQQLAEVSFV
jgi:hypothetical protein